MTLGRISRSFECSLILLFSIFSSTAVAEKLNPFAQREGPLISESGDSGANGDLSKLVATMTLQGTLISADQPLANIDGVLYGMGDTIGGYTILGISTDSVTLSRGDAEIALQIELQIEGSDASGRER